MTPKYICIHGHFYQPPRENAWLETVERQESAHPAHDWNERITNECYAPNARARILDGDGRITGLASNYEKMSFNFGPTLLAWMEAMAPVAYADVLESDRKSQARYEGHGSAIAQAYGHAILPLCNDRDRKTQVLWGIADFKKRFGRDPEGMWMPETAANTSSLEALAEAGILFTILAPSQCAAVRGIGESEWKPVTDGVDPSRAYRCPLPSGRSIVLFFYDGPISQGVAFEGLLNDGGRFAERLLGGLSNERGHAQLVHLATDGESYGHHHRHGEMALAAAFHRIEESPDAELINYGLYLERHPPEMEAMIHENTSWSCAHGVERWKSDCGCNGGRPGFHQRWRGPLRAAFDWLRDEVEPRCEEAARGILKDIWKARDDYIHVLLDRSVSVREEFEAKHAVRPLKHEERILVTKLLELQRHAMLMYTSCAWFFDDVAGIETTQVIQYAARVVQLARETVGVDLEAQLLERLRAAEGSMPQFPNGAEVYRQNVGPAVLDLRRVGAHYALSRTFDGTMDRMFAYDAIAGEERRRSAGRSKLVVGHATFRSRVTLEEQKLTYCVLHPGDHTTTCGVREFQSDEAFNAVAEKAETAFDRADYPEIVRLLNSEFDGSGYSIASLFRDEQHAVVRKILDPTLEQIDRSYQQIYELHAPMARFLRSLNLPVPRRILLVSSFVLSHSLRGVLEQAPPDLVRAAELVEEAKREGVELDQATVGSAIDLMLDRAVAGLTGDSPPVAHMKWLVEVLEFMKRLEWREDPWRLQHAAIERLRPVAEKMKKTPDEQGSSEWIAAYEKLCDLLRVAP